MIAADRVWNRAALENGGANPCDGDRALADLLLTHGLIMNGGVLHAFSSLEPTEWDAAISGYRFFGFEDIATLLERTASFDQSKFDDDDDPLADACDRAYAEAIPEDAVLLERFKSIYAASPSSFALA